MRFEVTIISDTVYQCFILQTVALSYVSGTISRFVFVTSTPKNIRTFQQLRYERREGFFFGPIS